MTRTRETNPLSAQDGAAPAARQGQEAESVPKHPSAGAERKGARPPRRLKLGHDHNSRAPSKPRGQVGGLLDLADAVRASREVAYWSLVSWPWSSSISSCNLEVAAMAMTVALSPRIKCRA